MIPLLTALTPVVGKLIDRVFPDEEAAAKAKLELLKLQQEGELADLEARAQIIATEAGSEHWLTANWRPLVMVTFAGLVVAHWLGFTAEGLSEVVVMQLLTIVQVGIGGYVVGRSAEKVAKAWKQPKS